MTPSIARHTLRGSGLDRVLPYLMLGPALFLVLGVIVFWHRGVLLVRTAHLAVGALVLVTSVSVAWVLRRHISNSPNRA